MGSKRVRGIVSLSVLVGLLMVGFQNCGTNFGAPRVDGSLSLSSFDPSGSTTAWQDIMHFFVPKADATLFEAYGCLNSIQFLKWDERWVNVRPDGTYWIQPSVYQELPFTEVYEQIYINEPVTLDPNGTDLGDRELPIGRYLRIAIGFNTSPECIEHYGEEFDFRITNDNGTFTGASPERWTGFRILDDFTIDEDTTRMIIHIQKIVDHLNTVESDARLTRGTEIEGLIEIE